mgnify:CR=1 FL=1
MDEGKEIDQNTGLQALGAGQTLHPTTTAGTAVAGRQEHKESQSERMTGAATASGNAGDRQWALRGNFQAEHPLQYGELWTEGGQAARTQDDENCRLQSRIEYLEREFENQRGYIRHLEEQNLRTVTAEQRSRTAPRGYDGRLSGEIPKFTGSAEDFRRWRSKMSSFLKRHYLFQYLSIEWTTLWTTLNQEQKRDAEACHSILNEALPSVMEDLCDPDSGGLAATRPKELWQAIDKRVLGSCRDMQLQKQRQLDSIRLRPGDDFQQFRVKLLRAFAECEACELHYDDERRGLVLLQALFDGFPEDRKEWDRLRRQRDHSGQLVYTLESLLNSIEADITRDQALRSTKLSPALAVTEQRKCKV